MFLAETQVDDARLEIVQTNIGFDHHWPVPREGKGGGLVLFWRSMINLTIKDSNKTYIDAFIDKSSKNEWKLMGFYGEPKIARRFEAWNKLRNLNKNPKMPWLCMADFNEIIRLDEKVRDAIRPHNQMQLFRDVIDECKFMDLGFVGPKFTWSRHFENGNLIWERLDRGSATNNWFLKFPGSRVHHIRCDSSNHCPLYVTFSYLVPPTHKRLFHFEEMWLSHFGYEEIVHSAWYSTGCLEGNPNILAKVDKCGKDKVLWNKNVFGNVRKELDQLRKLLGKAEEEAICSEIIVRLGN